MSVPTDTPLEAVLRARYEKAKRMDAEINEIPLFATNEPVAGEMSMMHQSLQSILNECDPNEIAGNLKKSGNECYALGKERWPDAMAYYSQAIDAKPTDNILLASLYSNRAQVHLVMGNYGKCVADAKVANEIDPTAKSYYRHAKALLELHKYAEAGSVARVGLVLGGNPELEKLHSKIIETQRLTLKLEMDAKRAKEQDDEMMIIVQQEISKLKIKSGPSMFVDLISDQGYVSKVYYVKEYDELHWPVLFLYPEFFQSDFIQDWGGLITFQAQVDVMLSSDNPAPWDQKKLYVQGNIEVFYESDQKKLRRVDLYQTLQEVIKQPDFILSGMNPVFYLLSNKSAYIDEFKARYR